mmetsp:Transcript_129036/g.275398  ORF Transcript_129036/g.275398 Transcript_129036/m.275398 type:complete len:248 (-) Transcript_129036:364-1107(-)
MERALSPLMAGNLVAVLVPIEVQHLLLRTTTHVAHLPPHTRSVHERCAPQVAVVPMAQYHHSVHCCLADMLAEGPRMGLRHYPLMSARVAEEGRVSDLSAEDEVLGLRDLLRVHIASKVKGRCALPRHSVLTVELEEAPAVLVARRLHRIADLPEVVVTWHCHEGLSLCGGADVLKELAGDGAEGVIEVIAEKTPIVELVRSHELVHQLVQLFPNSHPVAIGTEKTAKARGARIGDEETSDAAARGG